MKPKSEIDLAVGEALKTARTAIRLKHSLLADEEINVVLPEIEAQIQQAAVSGKPFRPDITSILKDILV